jgi:hypothetical protein
METYHIFNFVGRKYNLVMLSWYKGMILVDKRSAHNTRATTYSQMSLERSTFSANVGFKQEIAVNWNLFFTQKQRRMMSLRHKRGK